MYKLCFYVPADYLESVKQAVFSTGAGCIGEYDCCCWQVEGLGQFRPLDNARPFIGVQGQIERVREFRVELLCQQAHLRAAIDALIQAHPYEEPAYDVTAVVGPETL